MPLVPFFRHSPRIQPYAYQTKILNDRTKGPVVPFRCSTTNRGSPFWYNREMAGRVKGRRARSCARTWYQAVLKSVVQGRVKGRRTESDGSIVCDCSCNIIASGYITNPAQVLYVFDNTLHLENLCSPNEDFGRQNKRSRVFKVLFKGVSIRFGLRIFEKSFENARAIFCSVFQNLRLGSINFSNRFNLNDLLTSWGNFRKWRVVLKNARLATTCYKPRQHINPVQ
jgi:hypothetical protein